MLTVQDVVHQEIEFNVARQRCVDNILFSKVVAWLNFNVNNVSFEWNYVACTPLDKEEQILDVIRFVEDILLHWHEGLTQQGANPTKEVFILGI